MRHPRTFAAEPSARSAVLAAASFVAFALVVLAPAAGSAATITSLELPGFSGDESVIRLEGNADSVLSHSSLRIDTLGFAPVPERSTMLLLATGLGGLTVGGRRRHP